MRDLFFFLKCLAFTLVTILILQIRLGHSTLEDRAMFFVHDSPLVRPLQEVADGGLKLLSQGWQAVAGVFHTKINQAFKSENFPGRRSLGVQLKRSEQYLKEKTGQR